MPSVTSIFELFGKLEDAHIALDRGRCVTIRNCNVECMRCARACSAGCISLEDDELVISPEKCIGCAACASVCPTGALRAKDPTDRELREKCLAASLLNDGEAVIACDQLLDAASGMYDPDRVVGVPCLGRVDESLSLSLASKGVSRIMLSSGKCDECPYSCGIHVAKMARDTANVLLEAWKSPARVSISPKLPGKVRLSKPAEYDHRRREFFTGLTGKAKTAAVASADLVIKDTLGVNEPEAIRYVKVNERGVLPQEFPKRRKLLLDSLDELGEPDDVALDTRLWASVSIDMDLCTSCRMCATFCPTGAIFRFSTKKGKIGIKHRARQCVSCGCCESICRTNALTLTNTVASADIMSAEVSRFVMPPLDSALNQPQSIYKSMKKLLDCGQMYER